MSCLFCGDGRSCDYCSEAAVAEDSTAVASFYPEWFTGTDATVVVHKRRVQAGLHPLGGHLHEDASRTCGDCVHLVRKRLASVYFKCGLRRVTGGPASDLRLKWRGCEHHERKE